MQKNKSSNFYYIYLLMLVVIFILGYKNFAKFKNFFNNKISHSATNQQPSSSHTKLNATEQNPINKVVNLEENLALKLKKCEDDYHEYKKQISDEFEHIDNYRLLLQNLSNLNKNFYSNLDCLNSSKSIHTIIKSKNESMQYYNEILLKLENFELYIVEYLEHQSESKKIKIYPSFLNKLLSKWLKIELVCPKIDLANYYNKAEYELKGLNKIFYSTDFMKSYLGS